MDSEQHPFQAGVEVAIVTRGYQGTRYTLGRVEKVHKTGRFVLVGGQQQYRANRDSYSKEWRGSATSRSGFYGHPTIELVNDDLRREAAATKRQEAFMSAVATLDKHRRLFAERVTAEQLAGLVKLIEQLEAKQWSEDDCPGHVASDRDPKICGRCGAHIDSLRPPEDE